MTGRFAKTRLLSKEGAVDVGMRTVTIAITLRSTEFRSFDLFVYLCGSFKFLFKVCENEGNILNY